MSAFLDKMKAQAKADLKTIVLPEGEDPRTIEAAKAIVAEGIANIVILGDPAEIEVEGAIETRFVTYEFRPVVVRNTAA